MSTDPRMAEHRDAWETLGRVDPLWAVLTDPTKRGRGWDEQEFMATGRQAVDRVLAVADRLGRPLSRSAALDFGCGVGRLTLPLAERFDAVTGVDISRSMVSRAVELAEGHPNVTYETVEAADLGQFPDHAFDFVLSLFVLQHLPAAAYAEKYLTELSRLVRPGGILVVQLPSPMPLRRRWQPRRRAFGVLRRLGFGERALFDRLGLSPMRMIGLTQARVRELLRDSGLEILEVHADLLARSHVDSFTYYAGRPSA